MNELTTYQNGVNSLMMSDSKMDSMLKFAMSLIKSGFLPASIKSPEQAVAIILTGQELGITPMQALRQINVIQGKPTMSAELMLSLAYSRIPGFRSTIIVSDANKCTVEMQRGSQPAYQHTFTMQEATAMGLSGKDNWKKQPAVMLRWRCISAALRIMVPDAIAGIYSSEEINPDVKIDYDTGEIIEEAKVIQRPQAVDVQPVKVEAIQVQPPVNESASNPPIKQIEMISEAQRKRLFALLKEGQIDMDDFKYYLSENWGIHSSKEIPKNVYKEIEEWIAKNSTVVRNASHA